MWTFRYLTNECNQEYEKDQLTLPPLFPPPLLFFFFFNLLLSSLSLSPSPSSLLDYCSALSSITKLSGFLFLFPCEITEPMKPSTENQKATKKKEKEKHCWPSTTAEWYFSYTNRSVKSVLVFWMCKMYLSTKKKKKEYEI